MPKPYKKILFIIGTRPEALKLAPVILEAKKNRFCKPLVCLTAQHRHMADDVLKLFGIKAHYDLNLMKKNQTLGHIAQKLIPSIESLLQKSKPDLLVVQGDTSSAFLAALAAFYNRIPVAHVEAGLRSYNKAHPFPEEINRRLITPVADFHFAPTKEAAENLAKENVPAGKIWVTGNTVLDSVKLMRRKKARGQHPLLKKIPARQKLVLVTAHRRESLGEGLRSICRALKQLAESYPDIEIVYPVHLNPRVKLTVERELKGRERIHLLKPLGYQDFLRFLERSFLILTDSGGVQEEAPSFGKPVLVMREVTEREEGVARGFAKLTGTSKEIIFREAGRLIRSRAEYKKMIPVRNPYGNGTASQKILRALL